MRRANPLLCVLAALVVGACDSPQSPTELRPDADPRLAASGRMIRVNVLLNRAADAGILAELGEHGTVTGRLDAIHAVFMRAPESELAALRARRYVAAANPDERRHGSPRDPVEVEDFSAGSSTFNLDASNVTDFGSGRTVGYDGAGVYVGVLDTGLLDTWRQYFPQERIAESYAKAFVGADPGTVADVPNQWEHDTNSHGTHVTSTILGYDLRGSQINGVAPRATVIPVKVLGQQGWGWTSMIARGIVYIADLKTGPLQGHPVVINMSLGGSRLDAVEKAALDYAIARGVIIVASAGNSGLLGMGYPGAYEPVISVAAAGWKENWRAGDRRWWLNRDVPDPTSAADYYIAAFSSREKDGQDLDVAAPGAYVVGPYQLQSGRTSYYFLSGTSMAAPHVAGIVALMAQKKPGLTAAEAEAILEETAIPLPGGCSFWLQPWASYEDGCWAGDATGAGLATADAALLRTH